MIMMPKNTLTCDSPEPIITREQGERGVPPEALDHFSQGITLSQQGKHQEAREAYDEALGCERRLSPGMAQQRCDL